MKHCHMSVSVGLGHKMTNQGLDHKMTNHGLSHSMTQIRTNIKKPWMQPHIYLSKVNDST